MHIAPSSPSTLVSPDVSPDIASGSTEKVRVKVRPLSASTRGVMLIGLFKLSKAIFFTCLGVAALHMLHRNLGDLVLRLTDVLPLDPEGRLVGLLMDKADLIGNHQLREFSLATLAYAVVCLIEGIGLLRQRPWAEYFTVTLTALALPWELYELARRPSLLRLGVLAVNLAVLAYLLWILKRNKRRHAEPASFG